MKKMLSLVAIVGLVCGGLLAGCQKAEVATPPDVTATNAPATPPVPAAPAAPAAPDTNAPAAPAAPATNAPAQ